MSKTYPLLKPLNNEVVILVPPLLAKEIGVLEAIFLQQVHEWLEAIEKVDPETEENPVNYIRRPKKVWLSELPFITFSEYDRVIASLHPKGLLTFKNDYDHLTMRIDYEKLATYKGHLVSTER